MQSAAVCTCSLRAPGKKIAQPSQKKIKGMPLRHIHLKLISADDMRANGIAFCEVAVNSSMRFPLFAQNSFASTRRSALILAPGLAIPAALCLVIMYVSGPVAIGPLDEHALSENNAIAIKNVFFIGFLG